MKSPSAEPDGRGSVRITGAAALTTFFCLGLIGGWGYHYARRANSGLDPSVTWPAAAVLLFLAAFLALAALRTRQARKSGVRVSSQRAVNLLVLGKACARVGAAAFGAYLGFALGYLRASMSVPGQQLLLVGLSCLGGIVMMLAALALEWSCRVSTPDDPEDPSKSVVR